MRYKRVYELLKTLGHTPMKAAEIVLDASRKNDHALTWVKIAFRGRAAGRAIAKMS